MAENRMGLVNTPAFLQTVSIGFSNPILVADRLAPRVPVTKQEGKYRIWGKGNLRDYSGSTRWAPGTIPNAIDTKFTEALYGVDIHKLRHPLLDQEISNADEDLQLRTTYTETTTDAIAIAREVRVATLFTTAANYNGSHTVTKAGGQEWNLVPANVLTDLDTAIAKVALDAMVPQNMLTVAIPQPVWDVAIKRNSSILGLIQYSERGVVTQDLLANLLGVKEVILVPVQAAGAAPETEGMDILTGYATSYLWGDNVWVGYIAPNTNVKQPTFALSLNWQAGTGGQQRRVKQYRMADEGQEGDWIEVAEAVREVITFKDAGYLIKNVSSLI
jgi:hypothetical protein